MKPLAPPHHLGSLQILRCVAAIMVVIAHAPGALRRAGYDSVTTWHAGNGAVDVFFVLSGLVIASSAGRLTTSDRATFIMHRGIRIVPLGIAAALLATVTLRWGAGDVTMLVRSLLFLPTEAAREGRFTSSYSAAWTLSYEAFFYLCFAALLGLRPITRTRAILGLFTALVACGLALGDRANGLLDFYTDPIVLEFAVGVGLFHVLGPRWHRIPASIIAAAHLVAWVVLLVFIRSGRDELGDLRLLARGMPAMVIVATAVLLEQRGRFPRNRVLERLGDSSYALYMSHLFVIAGVGEAWRIVGLTDHVDRAVLVLISILLSLAVGELVDRLFDRPIRRVLAARMLDRRRTVIGSGATS